MNTKNSFDNTRCMALDKDLHSDEYLEFRQDAPVSKYDYLMTNIRNSRYYLMKEDESTIPKARRRMYILAVLHYGLKTLFWGAVIFGCLDYLRSMGIYKNWA